MDTGLSDKAIVTKDDFCYVSGPLKRMSQEIRIIGQSEKTITKKNGVITITLRPLTLKEWAKSYLKTHSYHDFVFLKKENIVFCFPKDYSDFSVAKCMPIDKFNYTIGKAIALCKLLEERLPEQVYHK